MSTKRTLKKAPAEVGAGQWHGGCTMTTQPDWFVGATDLALGIAAAEAADKSYEFDKSRLFEEAFQYFEERQILGLSLNHKLLPYIGYGGFGVSAASKAVRVLNTISCSPNAEKVWKTFERFGNPPPLFFVRLCFEVSMALEDFDRVAITAKDLKGSSSRIRTLALKLAEELSNPAIKSALERARVISEPELRRQGSPSAKQLLSLADIALVIPSLPKFGGQPNSPNARRLYFIRRVTDWVYKKMRTPMRSQVLAMTSVFFDVDDLAPQTLATLAPVSKKLQK